MPRKFSTIGISLTAVALNLWAVQWLAAQTWTGPTSAPPASNIPSISLLGGDNLGNHVAKYDLRLMTDNGDRWPIQRIGSAVTDLPALQVRTYQTATGIDVSTNNGVALYADSASPLATIGAFKSVAIGLGYGLIADSGSDGISAKLYSTLTLQTDPISPAKLQIGSATQNSLTIGPLGSVPPAVSTPGNLWYGKTKLCDVGFGGSNCGFSSSGTLQMDNLGDLIPAPGPYLAQIDLNMNSHRIVNIGSATADSALVVHSLGIDAGIRVDNQGTQSFGLTSALSGWSQSANVNHAGIYGAYTGIFGGPGIYAASATGYAAKIYGRLNVYSTDDNAATTTIGAPENTLSINRQDSQTSDDLYWGKSLLCDSASNNCGWQPNGGSAQWLIGSYPANVYYTAVNVSNPVRTNVGIGINLPNYQLDVADTARTTGASIGSLLTGSASIMNDAQVGGEVYVGGNLTVNTAEGFSAEQQISVGSNGITIGGTRLSQSDFEYLLTRCGAACN